LLGAGLEAVETDVEALAAWWREAERGRVLAAQMDAQHAAAGRRGDQPARSPALVVLLHAAAPAAAAFREDEQRLAASQQPRGVLEHAGERGAAAAAVHRETL